MLLELSVHNLVIVEKALLAPGEGLTVVTGETGAGKSLLLDALDLVFGGRARSELVGPAGDETAVTAVFQVESGVARAVAAATGVEPDEGRYLLRRRITSAGRSQAWINDVPVTVAALRAAAGHLAEVHAQHAALALAEPASQLAAIDAFGGIEVQAEAYRALHEQVLAAERRTKEIEEGARGSVKELDFLRFQEAEFAALKPVRGEFLELERRHRALSEAEDWRALADEAVDRLVDGQGSAVQVVGRLGKRLSEAPDERLLQAGQACQQAAELLREAGRSAAAAGESLHADPAELERIGGRLDAWHQLMRKHGDGEEAVITAWEQVRARIAELDGLDERRAAVAAELQRLRDQRQQAGTALAAARTQAFAKLARIVHGHLADLGMPKARISLGAAEGEVSIHGTVRQEILACTNPGLDPAPVGAIASGGEASRLSLALAAATARQNRVPVLVFDEVDSGVGGRLGAAIGAKLAELAAGRTVIAVSHTPQLAAVARRHLVVRKNQGRGTTRALVEDLVGDARLREIAEMIGGGPAAVQQARALLAEAKA